MAPTEETDRVERKFSEKDFRLRVEAIVNEALRNRPLTVDEVNRIEGALKTAIEIVIAKKIQAAIAEHDDLRHKGWELRGWAGILTIASVIASAWAAFEIVRRLLR